MESAIPITFEHAGIKYNGQFSKVMGAGDTCTLHLIDHRNFYLGRLRYSGFSAGWVFDPTPKTQELKSLADYFGDYITNWIQ